MRKLIAGGIAALAAILLTGCGDSQPAGPARARIGEAVPIDIDNTTVATVCNHGNRIYVSEGYKQGGLAVVPADPTCQGVK